MKYIFIAVVLLLTNSITSVVPAQSKETQSISIPDTTRTSNGLTIADSTGIIDSSAVAQIKPDTLRPVFNTAIITNNNYIHTLSNTEILGSDYRYTGNLVTSMPFGYLNDLGSQGFFNEALLYGFGFGNQSFLSDDISFNNRFTNSIDLHLLQSESIDSIYMLPLTRGFLINPDNNPVSVNLISKDRIDIIPYTRIRYYQGTNDEGFIDALFSAYVTSRLNVSVGISNSSKEDEYTNSEYGNWSGRIKLRYMLSNKLNILASYHYSKANTPLNGGVDYQEITETYQGDQIDEIFYDNKLAPVNYEDKYVKQTTNNFNVRLLGNFLTNLPTTLTFYYNYGLSEFRQNEFNSYENVDSISRNHSCETYGAQLTQSFNFKYAFLDVTGNYENVKYITPLLTEEKSANRFSAFGIAGLKIFDNTIVPNVFGKALITHDKTYLGFGSDLSLNFGNSFSLYGGIAAYAKPYSMIVRELLGDEDNSEKFYIFESGFRYNSSKVKTSLSLVTIKQDNQPVAVGAAVIDTAKSNTISGFTIKNSNRASLNLNAEIHFHPVKFTTNINYNLFEESTHNQVPEFSIAGGVYYVDTLFESNLNLKTGFNYYMSGNTKYFLYDFEKSLSYNYIFNSSGDITLFSDKTFDPTFRLDFFLAGTIQEAATLYLVFENLLDTQYFIVPYYPMPGRSFRLGVSWELFN